MEFDKNNRRRAKGHYYTGFFYGFTFGTIGAFILGIMWNIDSLLSWLGPIIAVIGYLSLNKLEEKSFSECKSWEEKANESSL